MSKARMPILQKSTKRVNVATGGTHVATNVNPLTIPQVSTRAAETHTFKNFPTLPLRVDKVNNDGNVSIITQQRVTVGAQRRGCIHHSKMTAGNFWQER